MSAITPVPMPTQLSLIPAGSSPIKFPAPAADADFTTQSPATATATSTGTTSVTLAGSAGSVRLGATMTGSGVPANTTIIAQQSGTPGGNGVYTTNHATTLAGVAVSLAPPLPIDPSGDTPPSPFPPPTGISSAPPNTGGNNPYTWAPTAPPTPGIPIALATTFTVATHPPFVH